MSLDRKHILRQSAVLLRIGVNEMDVERTVNWVTEHLPANANPATWIPSAAQLSEDSISEAAVVDSRNAWYGSKSVGRKYQRLLDARGE